MEESYKRFCEMYIEEVSSSLPVKGDGKSEREIRKVWFDIHQKK